MIHHIRQNKIYFICLGIYFLVGAIILLSVQKGALEVFINRRHNLFFDYFFLTITYLGDGLFIVPFILFIILFNSIYKGILLTVSVLITFVFVQSLKIGVFPDMPRPKGYFPESMKLYYIEGLKIHSHHSFPSGHSAQAFAFLLVLALTTKNKSMGWVFFLFALLTAVSRMYLMQHFLLDTYFGALIATLVTLFAYMYFTNQTKLSENERWQKGLLR